jgi:hypothetical protein
LDIGDENRCSGVDEPVSDSKSQPLSRTRDDNDLIGKFTSHDQPPQYGSALQSP